MDAIKEALKRHMMKMKSAGHEEAPDMGSELEEIMSDKAPKPGGEDVMMALPGKEAMALPGQDGPEDSKLKEEIMKILMGGGDHMDKVGQSMMMAKRGKMKM